MRPWIFFGEVASKTRFGASGGGQRDASTNGIHISDLFSSCQDIREKGVATIFAMVQHREDIAVEDVARFAVRFWSARFRRHR